jgi:hemerythrin-like domain-containing protein
MSEPGKPDTREMIAVHTAFRREFALLPELLRGVSAGDSERAKIVGDHVAFMVNFLHHHHHAEDEHLWPRLLERAPKECDPLVYLMERQHAVIGERLYEIEAASGETLAVGVNSMLVPLFEHLAMEEERILPLAYQYITLAEWDAMAEAAAASLHEHFPIVLGMILYEGDPDTVQAMLTKFAGANAPVLRAAATQGYGEYAERVYGTATPSRSTILRRAG